MAQQIVNVGNTASDGTGDELRDAFTKINANFTELYSGNLNIAAANIRVYSVAGRDGNVILTVNDVAQAASKSYVDTAISANLANVTTTITNSLRANISAANAVIADHTARITTLESNSAAQASQINNLVAVKANVSYVDTSIDNALSSNAILANVQSVNANVAAANAAILLRANLSGANFTGNISANSINTTNFIRTNTYLVAGTEANQGLGQAFANPAALFFGDSSSDINKFYQINLQNLDPAGTGDIVVTADDGSDVSNYIAFGVAGSAFFDPQYPSSQDHDGYVFIRGGNLDLQSETGNVELISGNLTTGQVILTQSNILKLGTGVRIQFADGTVQSTAFGGNVNISSINANVTAANVAIANLQSNAATQALELDSLVANAGTQGTAINLLNANTATQAVAINTLNANIGAFQTVANSNASSQATSINLINANVTAANVAIANLQSNAATQALELNQLQTNAQSQQGSIIVLQSNATVQAVSINLLNSNVAAANANISSLTTNAATQSAQIGLLNANVTAANLAITNLQTNAASQALDINSLRANIDFYLSNVSSSNANITAANSRIIIIDANLGSTNTNVSSLQSNAVAQSVQINLLNANVAAANIVIGSKADLIDGNIQANYVIANANVKITSTLEVGNPGTIDYPGLGGTFVGNVDGYYQIVIQNTSNSSSSSGDLVITADDGTDENYYLNLGMNSSNFVGNFVVPSGDTGLVDSPRTGYLQTIGGDMAVRSDGNVFLAANTRAVGLLKDSNFTLVNTNLQFSDGSVQTGAIEDIPGLYANIGTLSLFQSNIVGNAAYTPNNAANYNGTITNIQEALDELAARLKALGG